MHKVTPPDGGLGNGEGKRGGSGNQKKMEPRNPSEGRYRLVGLSGAQQKPMKDGRLQSQLDRGPRKKGGNSKTKTRRPLRGKQGIGP